MATRQPRVLVTHWNEYIHYAAEARDNTKKVVADNPAAWPGHDVLAAILFSAIATEAFINDLGEIAEIDGRDAEEIQLPAAYMLADLAAVLASIEADKGGVQLKYHMAYRVLTGRAFQVNSPPFQDFNLLMRVRNLLVHPRQGDQHSEHGHIEPASRDIRTLQQRGLTQTRGRRPGDPGGGMSWMNELYTERMATWAHATARDIIVAVIEELPGDRLFAVAGLKNWAANHGPNPGPRTK
jgi:hypothetical protein